MDSPLAFMTGLARQAGALLMDWFDRPGRRDGFKADHSVVTEADVAADAFLADAIRRQYPEDVLLSEELRPEIAAEQLQSRRPVWVIDPLDGTTNFSLGLHVWGTLIARLEDGWTRQAVMFFPRIDELYTAEHGVGAFLNGERLQARPPDPQRPAAFFTCCSRTYRRYRVSVPYKPRILGSAAYSLCCVARGAALVAFEATPKIWDIAAGWLLVSEAGGAIATMEGSQPFPLQPGMDYARQSFPTLAAATPELAARSREQIEPRRA